MNYSYSISYLTSLFFLPKISKYYLLTIMTTYINTLYAALYHYVNTKSRITKNNCHCCIVHPVLYLSYLRIISSIWLQNRLILHKYLRIFTFLPSLHFYVLKKKLPLSIYFDAIIQYLPPRAFSNVQIVFKCNIYLKFSVFVVNLLHILFYLCCHIVLYFWQLVIENL